MRLMLTMLSMLLLHKLFNINNISGDILYSIQENKLYLVISSSKNRMEFKRFKNNYEELIESLKEDVSPILETIKQFDLKGEEKE